MKTNGPQRGPVPNQDFPITFQLAQRSQGGVQQPLFFVNGAPVTVAEAIDTYAREIGPREEFNNWFGGALQGRGASAQDVQKIINQLTAPGIVPRGGFEGYSSMGAEALRTGGAGQTQSRFGGTQRVGPDTSRDDVARQILEGLANWNRQ